MTSLQHNVRPARLGDVDAIVRIWHSGWREAHLGHVPATLLAHRQPSNLRARVPVRLATTMVATVGTGIAGFVVTHVDEIEQLYVDAAFRGTGVAKALLDHGESVIAATSQRAWLAVVEGNARARRFYERCGWHDAGPFDTAAWAANGATIPVPCRRYEKQLTSPAEPAPTSQDHAARQLSSEGPPAPR